MLRLFKPVCLMVVALCAGIPCRAFAEDSTPATGGSEREPEAVQRGNTYNEGPKNVFGGAKKETKDEAKPEKKETKDEAKPEKKEKAETSEKTEKAEKEMTEAEKKDKEKAEKAVKEKAEAEKKDKEKAEKAAKEKAEEAEKASKREKKEKEKKEKQPKEEAQQTNEQPAAQKACGPNCGPTCASCKKAGAAKVAAANDKLTPEQIAAQIAEQRRLEAEAARARAEREAQLRNAIQQLSTAGWREAQAQLTRSGKIGVPLLIEAMGNAEGELAHAYNLGGHTKADAGRAPRQRTIADVCCELLTTMVATHTSYKGDLPAVDQKAWQEWWSANSEALTFGN